MSKGAKVVKGIVLKNHPKLQVPKGQTTGNVQTSRKNIQSLEVHLHNLCVDLFVWGKCAVFKRLLLLLL